MTSSQSLLPNQHVNHTGVGNNDNLFQQQFIIQQHHQMALQDQSIAGNTNSNNSNYVNSGASAEEIANNNNHPPLLLNNAMITLESNHLGNAGEADADEITLRQLELILNQHDQQRLNLVNLIISLRKKRAR